MTGQERTMDERAAETRELLDELRKHVQPDELATVGIIFDLDGFAETFSAVVAALAEHEAEVRALKSEKGEVTALLAWAMETLIHRDGMSEEDYAAGLIPEHGCSPEDCTCSFGHNYAAAVNAAFSDPPTLPGWRVG